MTFNGNKSLKNYNTNRIYCDKINFFGNDLINGNLIISANYGIVSNNKITNDLNKLKLGSFKSWDSLTHIKILLSIEKSFKIKFSLKEIEKLDSIENIIKLLKKK